MTHRDPMAMVGRDHPLARLFATVCERSLERGAGVDDPVIADYLAALLLRFAHVHNLHRIRDAAGRPLDDVGEMLLEADPLDRAPSFEREREVRRHIGDYTLFWLGLFPEHLHRHATTRVPDLYVDWAATGRESYRIVAAFTVGPHAAEAPLFARLSDLYDRCVLALHFTKRELERLGRPELRAAGDVLGGPGA